jgi:hypothetical protein
MREGEFRQKHACEEGGIDEKPSPPIVTGRSCPVGFDYFLAPRPRYQDEQHARKKQQFRKRVCIEDRILPVAKCYWKFEEDGRKQSLADRERDNERSTSSRGRRAPA